MNTPGKKPPQHNSTNPPTAHGSVKPTVFAPVEHDGSLSPVTLVKGSHQWTFSCDPGDESVLLSHLSELATDPSVPFDWFDAALVSHQLSRRLTRGLARATGGACGVDGQNNKEDSPSGIVVKKAP